MAQLQCVKCLATVIDQLDIFVSTVSLQGWLHDRANIPNGEMLYGNSSDFYFRQVREICANLPYNDIKVINGTKPEHPCTYVYAKTTMVGAYTNRQLLLLKRYIDYCNKLNGYSTEYPSERRLSTIWIGELYNSERLLPLIQKVFADLDVVIYHLDDGIPF